MEAAFTCVCVYVSTLVLTYKEGVETAIVFE